MPHGWAKPISAISAISAGQKNNYSAGLKINKSAGQINSSSVGTYIFCEKIKYLGGRNVKDVRYLQNFV